MKQYLKQLYTNILLLLFLYGSAVHGASNEKNATSPSSQQQVDDDKLIGDLYEAIWTDKGEVTASLTAINQARQKANKQCIQKKEFVRLLRREQKEIGECLGAIEGKEIVLILGKTRVGKSTLVNRFLGHKFNWEYKQRAIQKATRKRLPLYNQTLEEIVAEESESDDESREKVFEMFKASSNIPVAPIGDNLFMSCTKVPQVYPLTNKFTFKIDNDTYTYDCTFEKPRIYAKEGDKNIKFICVTENKYLCNELRVDPKFNPYDPKSLYFYKEGTTNLCYVIFDNDSKVPLKYGKVSNFKAKQITRLYAHKGQKPIIKIVKNNGEISTGSLRRGQYKDSCKTKVAPIQHRKGSSELYEEQDICNKQKSEVVLVDCPGFDDPEGVEQEILNRLLIRLVVKKAKKVNGIIFVLPDKAVLSDETLIANIENRLLELVKKLDYIVDYKQCLFNILWCFTQYSLGTQIELIEQKLREVLKERRSFNQIISNMIWNKRVNQEKKDVSNDMFKEKCHIMTCRFTITCDKISDIKNFFSLLTGVTRPNLPFFVIF